MLTKVYFFDRRALGDNPAGVTVSKRAELPEEDFGITEYLWGCVSLWFVDADDFSEDERNIAWEAFLESIC